MNYIQFIKNSKFLFAVLNYRGLISHVSFGMQAMLPPELINIENESFANIIANDDKPIFKKFFKSVLGSDGVLYVPTTFIFSDKEYIIAGTKESENEIILTVYPVKKTVLNNNIQVIPTQTILVVDDNKMNIALMKGLLEKLGNDVFTAFNGKEALEILEEKPITMCFTDGEMPIMDGYTFSKRARAVGFDLPIVAVTGNEDAYDKAMQSGMNDSIIKPISEEKIKNALTKWYLKKYDFN